MFSIERPAERIQQQGEQTQEQVKVALREAEQRCAALQRDLDRAQADAGAQRRLETEARKNLEEKATAAATSAAEARARLAQFRRQAATERERHQKLQALAARLESELL